MAKLSGPCLLEELISLNSFQHLLKTHFQGFRAQFKCVKWQRQRRLRHTPYNKRLKSPEDKALRVPQSLPFLLSLCA